MLLKPSLTFHAVPMTSIADLESRKTALIQRITAAGGVIAPLQLGVPNPQNGPAFVEWDLNGERIEVPELDELNLGRVATMLIEAEESLEMAIQAPER